MPTGPPSPSEGRSQIHFTTLTWRTFKCTANIGSLSIEPNQKSIRLSLSTEHVRQLKTDFDADVYFIIIFDVIKPSDNDTVEEVVTLFTGISMIIVDQTEDRGILSGMLP